MHLRLDRNQRTCRDPTYAYRPRHAPIEAAACIPRGDDGFPTRRIALRHHPRCGDGCLTSAITAHPPALRVRQPSANRPSNRLRGYTLSGRIRAEDTAAGEACEACLPSSGRIRAAAGAGPFGHFPTAWRAAIRQARIPGSGPPFPAPDLVATEVSGRAVVLVAQPSRQL